MSITFAIKGNICYSKSIRELALLPAGYVICKDGVCQGAYDRLPEQYGNIPVRDYGDQIVIPGLVDLHLHASQYAFRGIGMQTDMLDWLYESAYPEEAKYVALDYAKSAYRLFVDSLRSGATTRAVISATVHVPATLYLMDILEQSGLCTYVGKVNMDCNTPDILKEKSATTSLADTLMWVEYARKQYTRTKPILSPRFVPAVSEILLNGMRDLQTAYHLPLQSHLSESRREVAWVKKLYPDVMYYADVYEKHELFGTDYPAIMAHCVYPAPAEVNLMQRRSVYIAHCPQSDANLSSGIAPVRAYLNREMRVGLGTDIGAGCSPSILRAMADAIQMSKLRYRLLDENMKPLDVAEAFYLGTLGGGEFFGKVGSFDRGYEFDAVILSDERLSSSRQLSLDERLERLLFLSEECEVAGKYVQGIKLF